MTCKIIGVGGFLPNAPISNIKLAEFVDTDDQWIKSRTGITQRHFATPEQTTADLAEQAALAAIKDANIDPSIIDLVIVCSTTPDKVFPSTATVVQGRIGLLNIPSFDLNAVCSGFIYGLHIANSLIKADNARNILLIGAEKMSTILDWHDRSTAVLFGDGAGAVIITRASDDHLFESAIFSDGSQLDVLKTVRGESIDLPLHKISMKGQELYKIAISKMASSMMDLLDRANLTVENIDFFIPHQANIRIINTVADKMNIPKSKLITTVTKHANTSAASIPLALADYKANTGIIDGNIGAFTAVGAGLTWGSVIMQF